MVVSPLGRLFQSLSRTREKISNAVRRIAAAKVSSDSLHEIEALLLSADVVWKRLTKSFSGSK